MRYYEAEMETYQYKKIPEIFSSYTKSSTIIIVLALFCTYKILNNFIVIKI